MAKESNKTDEQFAKVESALSKTEQYVEDNQKKLIKLVGGIIFVIALFLAFNKLYLDPMKIEAGEDMWNAQIYFEKDSMNLALDGDGQYLGFIELADKYSLTKKEGNLLNYYSGVSYLYLKEYENSIKCLKDFSSDNIILSALANGCIGDAYVELNDFNNALKYYKKAINFSDNSFTSAKYLMKTALIREENKDYDAALEIYLLIKTNFKDSWKAEDIDKYIFRAQNRL